MRSDVIRFETVGRAKGDVMLDAMWQQQTDPDERGPAHAEVSVQGFRLDVVEGPSAGASFSSSSDRCSIGSHESNDLVVDDRKVSRFHCEIRIEKGGARLHDLGSKNGTTVDGVRSNDVWLRDGSMLRIGGSVISFQHRAELHKIELSDKDAFGSLVGGSAVMRASFAMLERAAASDVTVMVEGETGTGKEGAAESLHEHSDRRDRPLVVVDCSTVPANLLESELFGHERGAFTGATQRRIGAFEAAHGGTLFLDEIGELPLDLQPKLLRVLESREIRRVGGTEQTPIDVRVVAATNRTLRVEVNEGRFRPDLYYRLAVLVIRLPPLRERPEDIPLLAEHILTRLGVGDIAISELLTKGFLGRLMTSTWPGNVRELRNYIERCVVLREELPLPTAAPPLGDSGPPIDPRLSYAAAKRRALDDFERRYLGALLEHHGGNVSAAARSAELHRVYLHRLIRRHGLRE